jgi:molybdopterin converting factor subunit 1
MNIRVKLFAAARQRAGCDVATLQLPQGATVAQVREKLIERYPDLAGLSVHLVFAIDAEYAQDDAPVSENAEIACIPPVSGG